MASHHDEWVKTITIKDQASDTLQKISKALMDLANKKKINLDDIGIDTSKAEVDLDKLKAHIFDLIEDFNTAAETAHNFGKQAFTSALDGDIENTTKQLDFLKQAIEEVDIHAKDLVTVFGKSNTRAGDFAIREMDDQLQNLYSELEKISQVDIFSKNKILNSEMKGALDLLGNKMTDLLELRDQLVNGKTSNAISKNQENKDDNKDTPKVQGEVEFSKEQVIEAYNKVVSSINPDELNKIKVDVDPQLGDDFDTKLSSLMKNKEQEADAKGISIDIIPQKGEQFDSLLNGIIEESKQKGDVKPIEVDVVPKTDKDDNNQNEQEPIKVELTPVMGDKWYREMRLIIEAEEEARHNNPLHLAVEPERAKDFDARLEEVINASRTSIDQKSNSTKIYLRPAMSPDWEPLMNGILLTAQSRLDNKELHVNIAPMSSKELDDKISQIANTIQEELQKQVVVIGSKGTKPKEQTKTTTQLGSGETIDTKTQKQIEKENQLWDRQLDILNEIVSIRKSAALTDGVMDTDSIRNFNKELDKARDNIRFLTPEELTNNILKGAEKQVSGIVKSIDKTYAESEAKAQKQQEQLDKQFNIIKKINDLKKSSKLTDGIIDSSKLKEIEKTINKIKSEISHILPEDLSDDILSNFDKQVDDLSASLDKAHDSAEQFKQKSTELKTSLDSLTNSDAYKNTGDIVVKDADIQKLETYKAKVNDLYTALGNASSIDDLQNIQNELTKLGNKIQETYQKAANIGAINLGKDVDKYLKSTDKKYGDLSQYAETEGRVQLGGHLTRLQQIRQEISDIAKLPLTDQSTINKSKQDLEALEKEYKDIQSEIEKISKTSLFPQMNKRGASFEGLIDTNSLEAAKQSLLNTIDVIDRYNAKVSQSPNNDGTYKLTAAYKDQSNVLHSLSVDYDQASGALYKYGETTTQTLSLTERLSQAMSRKGVEMVAWASTFLSIQTVIQAFREGIKVITDVDTAMTELRKVSEATSTELNSFGNQAFEIGRTVGRTGEEVINSTAAFSRLGYTLSESSELARVANLYLNVGDDIDSIDTATSHLTSTLKAFGLEASDAMHIIDALNKVGK